MWRAFLLIGGFVLVLPFLGFFSFKAKVASDNAQYASKVFAGVVPYDRVIASRRWHKNNNWCTFAIVELSVEAAQTPPPSKPIEDWSFSFGSDDWSPTPRPELEYTGDSGWIMCRVALGEALFDRVSTTLTKPGGFWWEARDTLYLYAPQERLAVRLRDGD